MTGDYERAIEDVASWLESCCRNSSLYDRAEIAALLRLGEWKSQQPRRTANRDVPRARAKAEQWVRGHAEQRARAEAAKAAAAAGVEPMHDYYGLPVGEASRSYAHVADALGFGNPEAARIFEYGADGFTTVRDGTGKVVDRYPIGRRRNTRLAGHALAARVACLRCPDGVPRHEACECGTWRAPRGERCWFPSKSEERLWHTWHKEEIRERREAVESGAVVELKRAQS